MRFVALYNEELGWWLRDSRHGWYWSDELTLLKDEATAKKTLKAILAQQAKHNHKGDWYQERYNQYAATKVVHVTLGVEL